MNGRPNFITFTGADEHTSIDGMAALSRQYPVEWGILFSPKRQGAGRYPPAPFVSELLKRDGMRFSAHLCGGHSRSVLEQGTVDLNFGQTVYLNICYFDRAQINSAARDIDPVAVEQWAQRNGVEPILQCRGPFPHSTRVSWLYDKSGGRGELPDRWPEPHPVATCGYAGGIGPDNVLGVLAQIKATDFWIDMESRVRDEQDRFSLEKCRLVCEAVYGKQGGAE